MLLGIIMKKTLFKLILLGFVLAVVVGAVVFTESLLGAMGMQRQGVRREIVLREQPPLQILRETDQGKTVKIDIDAEGFIKPSRVHQSADYNIVFIGGSTTLCKAVAEDKRWVYLAGRLLEQETGRKINAFNNGVEGSNSAHSLNVLYNKVIPLKPDYVVMMHAFNDMIALLYCGDYWNDSPTRSLIKVKTTRAGVMNAMRNGLPHISAILEGVRNYVRDNWLSGADEFSAVRGRKLEYDREFMLKRFRNNLLLFIQMCRINDMAPVLMTQANRVTTTPDADILESTRKNLAGTGISYETYQKLYADFNDIIRKVAKEQGVDLIDLQSAIPAQKELIYDHLHYTDQGSEQAASVIAKEFSGIITRRNSESGK